METSTKKSTTVVTLECAGVLTGEKSAEIVGHVEQIWAQGQQAVELLRRELPEELVETLAPIRGGGVHLQKIFGVMHDTCHAANKVASLMVELRTAKAREFHGEEKWASMTPLAKACFDFLCGNHTRNLPIDWFNRLYNKWLQGEIGESLKLAKTAAGGMVRLECSGEAILRCVRHQKPPASGHVFDWLKNLDIIPYNRVCSGCTCFCHIFKIENTCFGLF